MIYLPKKSSGNIINNIVKSDFATIIQRACPARIYLPNSSVCEEAIYNSYQQFGLIEQQINIIANAVGKREYYYHSPLGNRLFNLDLGELSKAFCCVESKEDLAEFERILKTNSYDWINEWLAYKKLTDWCNYYRMHYK